MNLFNAAQGLLGTIGSGPSDTEPDTIKLNYHAGTPCFTVAQSVVTEHIRVRFYFSEIADAVTNVLLISMHLHRWRIESSQS